MTKIEKAIGRNGAQRRGVPIDPSVHGSQNFGAGQTFGAGGVAAWGGYIDSPEKDPRLQGRERYKTFSECIANTAIVGAGVRYFLNLIAKVGWRIEPPEGSGSLGKKHAELFEDIIYSMDSPWHRVVRRSAMHRFYGFSVQEWTAKRRKDGVVGLLDIEVRPQVTIERWDLDWTGKVLGVIQRSPQTQLEIYIPRQKLVYMVDDALNDSPEGLGILRHVVSTCKAIQRFELLEAYGFETDLRGVPIGTAPLSEMKEAGVSDADRNKLLQPMKDFLEKHIRSPELSMLLDSATYKSLDQAASPSAIKKWTIDVIRSESTALEPNAAAINRKNAEVARVLGVEHLLLGADSQGSLALARDKSHNLALIADSTLREIAETYETDIVGPIWTLNGWPDETKPTMKPEQVRFRDIQQITAALRDMATAGALLTMKDPAINEIRDLLGLSAAPEQDEPISIPSKPPIAAGGDNAESDPQPPPDENQNPPSPEPPAEGAQE